MPEKSNLPSIGGNRRLNRHGYPDMSPRLGTLGTFKYIGEGLQDPSLEIRERARQVLVEILGKFQDAEQATLNPSLFEGARNFVLQKQPQEPKSHYYQLALTAKAETLTILPLLVGGDEEKLGETIGLIESYLYGKSVTMKRGAIGAVVNLASYLAEMQLSTQVIPDSIFVALENAYRVVHRRDAGGESVLHAVSSVKDPRSFDLLFRQFDITYEDVNIEMEEFPPLKRVRFYIEWKQQSDMIKAFGELGDPRAVPLLLVAVNSGDPIQKHAALHALGEIGSMSAWEYLIGCVDNKKYNEWAETAEEFERKNAQYLPHSVTNSPGYRPDYYGYEIFTKDDIFTACIKIAKKSEVNEEQWQRIIGIVESELPSPGAYVGAEWRIRLMADIAQLEIPQFERIMRRALNVNNIAYKSQTIYGLARLHRKFGIENIEEIEEAALELMQDRRQLRRNFSDHSILYKALGVMGTEGARAFLRETYPRSSRFCDRLWIIWALAESESDWSNELLNYILENDKSRELREKASYLLSRRTK